MTEKRVDLTKFAWLSIAAADWTPQQIEQFRQQLRAAGWAVEAAGGVLTISRAAASGARA